MNNTKKNNNKLLASIAGATLLLAAQSGVANATPISFDVTSGSYSVGSGYGSGNAGKLDVTFTPLLTAPTSFTLSSLGMGWTYNFGTVRLNNEKCISTNGNTGCTDSGDIDQGTTANPVTGNETDDLGVTAILNLTNPFNGQAQNIAVVGTTTGPTGDTDTDFTIDFDPAEFLFGNGGKFTIDLSDLSFTGKNQTLTETVTFTLTQLETVATAEGNGGALPTIPEPGMIALMGLGLVGLGFSRRKQA